MSQRGRVATADYTSQAFFELSRMHALRACRTRARSISRQKALVALRTNEISVASCRKSQKLSLHGSTSATRSYAAVATTLRHACDIDWCRNMSHIACRSDFLIGLYILIITDTPTVTHSLHTKSPIVVFHDSLSVGSGDFCSPTPSADCECTCVHSPVTWCQSRTWAPSTSSSSLPECSGLSFFPKEPVPAGSLNYYHVFNFLLSSSSQLDYNQVGTLRCMLLGQVSLATSLLCRAGVRDIPFGVLRAFLQEKEFFQAESVYATASNGALVHLRSREDQRCRKLAQLSPPALLV